MKILSLKLVNFRNFEELTLDFSNKQNIIIGNNAAGKTNIVEAIYFLAITKSFRGTSDNILINQGKKQLIVEGIVKEKIRHTYKIVFSENGKIAMIDKNRITKLSDYISHINVVLFTPKDTILISDSPKSRRNMVNIEISQLEREYLRTLNLYNSVLKQRNAFLKLMYTNKNASLDYLNILTEKLVDLGLIIYKYRQDFIDDINEYIDKNYFYISKNKGSKVFYKSSYSKQTKDDLLRKYKEICEHDMLLGKTTFGVHHDDFIFQLGGKSLKDFGSEGEQKNAIICFKLSEIEIYIKKKNKFPILILDDLFSELDNMKIHNILKKINKNLQIFITTTDLDNIDTKILNNCVVFNIKKGKVVKKIYE